jgi:hypothetical protein
MIALTSDITAVRVVRHGVVRLTFAETETDLVSRRVGDYQYVPTIGALLDQLWVH